MEFGYVRVSTKKQNVARQIDQLKDQGVHKANIYVDKMSGKKFDRPKFNELLEVAEEGDVIIITELKRLGRSTVDLIKTINRLQEKKVELRSLKEDIDTTTPTGKMITYIFAVLAEFEADIIRERTNEGLKSARARGRVGGRPKVNADKVENALMLYDMGTVDVKQILTMTGISKSTFYNYLRERKGSQDEKARNDEDKVEDAQNEIV